VYNGPVYDCQQCGACCLAGTQDTGIDYVFLRPDEGRRMKRLGLTVIRVGGQSFLGAPPHAGAGGLPTCVAFAGRIGDDCRCSI